MSVLSRLPFLAVLAASPLVLGPLAAQAPAFTPPAEIDRAVAGFLAGDPDGAGATALPVDARLRLAPCRAALRPEWYGARRDSVKVECPDAGGWRVFVRVSGAVAGVAAAAPGAPAAPSGEPIVLRGEAVSIAVAGDGFTVSRSGEALEPGALGAWIKVRTAPAAPPLRARVSGPGSVEMALR